MNDPKRLDVSGSVMDGVVDKGFTSGTSINKLLPEYVVYRMRWVVMLLFVFQSGANALQWCQYAIIQDVVVSYYGVSSRVVNWTSLVYMLVYVPLIFPASWLLDKTVSSVNSFVKY